MKPAQTLGRRFLPLSHFRATAGYSLLPFRFARLDRNRYILSSFGGDYLVLPRETLRAFVLKRLPLHSAEYNDLKSRHFLIDSESSTAALELLAAQYRTRHARLADFTGLHIFVTTLRCNSTCVYCQASRRAPTDLAYDMGTEIADRAIDFMFCSPSPTLKVEFQGGEPLLNSDLLRYIVERTEARNVAEHRDIQFVICSNLALLTDDMLDFCAGRAIQFSTSLDGPRFLHNANRPSLLFDGYAATVDGIRRVRNTLGPDRVSALMTTTRASLQHPAEIIDEYVAQGLNSVFLRQLNPYGLAAKSQGGNGYSTDEWLQFYRTALDYIVTLNDRGVPFREEYSALILKKILTPYGTGFVDLQSPAGAGLAVLVYHYDGGVYLSDEARMLADMGDVRFRLGDLRTDPYHRVMFSDDFMSLLSRTMAEGVPGCVDCAYLPYCGSDPVRHYRMQGDPVGFKPTSDFCRKHRGVFEHLIRLLEDDRRAATVLQEWV